MAPAARSERITRQVAKILKAERERSSVQKASHGDAARVSALDGQPNPFGSSERRHFLPKVRLPLKKVGGWKPAQS